MNPSVYYNTALGSCLVIVLISIDYFRKFNTDHFQRKLLLLMLTAAFMSVITDFASRIITGDPGHGVTYAMYAVISFFLVFQNCTYYFGAVFIDYFIYTDIARSKKFIHAVCLFLIVHAISVMLNLPLGYYFTISSSNVYIPGSLYMLRLILSYASILVIIVDISRAPKFFKQPQAYLIIFFVLLTGLGASLDVMLKEGSLAWPCFSAAILYIYFFIVQSDSKIDTLTGIGNRYSFNEFIDKLSRQSSVEDYAIVMMDLDRFKEINDTLGHLEGDNALRDMATIIKGCIRHSDFAARYGGDEFVLVTKAENDIGRVMDRIQETINLQNEKQMRPYQIYMSYGYALFTTNSGQSMRDFLIHIDALMYKQKEERRPILGSSITAKTRKNHV